MMWPYLLKTRVALHLDEQKGTSRPRTVMGRVRRWNGIGEKTVFQLLQA